MLEIKILPKSQVEITGEITAEDFSKYWPKAIKKLAGEISLPGFRPGKIPENILVEKIGEKAVLEESAEMALAEEYFKIIQEKKIEAIGRPSATITKISKNGILGFKFQTAVLPEMKFPEDYMEIAKKIADKKEEITVDEKEIEASLEYLRKAKAGLKDGAELPILNDEFAKTAGEFKTLEELKTALRKNAFFEKELKSREKKRIEIMNGILNKSEFEIPEILVESEKKHMLEEMKARIAGMGLKWEDYLSHLKKKDLSAEALPNGEFLAKAEEEILNDWAEDALRRVKYGLFLEQISKFLKVEVSDEEINKEIEKHGAADKAVDTGRLKNYLYGIIRNEKVFSALGADQPRAENL